MPYRRRSTEASLHAKKSEAEKGDLQNHVDIVGEDVNEGEEGENEKEDSRGQQQRACCRVGLAAKRLRRSRHGCACGLKSSWSRPINQPPNFSNKL